MGGRLHHGTTAHGVLHPLQHGHLCRIPEIRGTGTHPRLFHRRGVYGRHGLSPCLQPRCAPDGTDHRPRCAATDRHHRHGRHRHQPLPLQGGYGHCGQTHPCRCRRGAHCQPRRGELPPHIVDPPPADRLLARWAGHHAPTRGPRDVHHGRRGSLFRRA